MLGAEHAQPSQENAYVHFPRTDRLTFDQMWYIARTGIFWG